MLNAVLANLHTMVAFVVVIGVLVFVHEFGHYLAARWRGVHVEAFSIGFGRAIATWSDRRGTIWKLAWLPLGGYVRLHGQEPAEEEPGEMRAARRPGEAFSDKSVGSRMIIVAAGPVANFVLAAVLFSGLCAARRRRGGLPGGGMVVAGAAAAAAGLAPGDRITAIDGKAIASFTDLQHAVVTHPAEALHLTVTRGAARREVVATPHAVTQGGRRIGVIGIEGGTVTYRPLNPLAAIPAGIGETWNVVVQTLGGLWHMVATWSGGSQLGGPLRIAQLSGEAATLGAVSFVNLIAVLSVNLGLLNLFPIPILDGGHLLFFTAEALRGRPLSRRMQELGLRFGLVLLATLFLFATRNDIAGTVLGKLIARLIG